MHNYETLIVFKSSHMVLNRNLRDIEHNESLITPAGEGNSMNWVLGHIITSRDDVRELLGLQKLYDKELEQYKRGSAQLDGANAIEFKKLLEMYNSGQEELENKLKETDLTGDNEKYRMVTFLAFHESYHTGQTGILRRAAGKEGAIK